MRLSEAAGAEISTGARPGYPPESARSRACGPINPDGPWRLPRLTGLWKSWWKAASQTRTPSHSSPTDPWKSLRRLRDSHSRSENAPEDLRVYRSHHDPDDDGSTRLEQQNPEQNNPRKRTLQPRRTPASLRSDKRSNSIGMAGRIRRNRQEVPARSVPPDSVPDSAAREVPARSVPPDSVPDSTVDS